MTLLERKSIEHVLASINSLDGNRFYNLMVSVLKNRDIGDARIAEIMQLFEDGLMEFREPLKDCESWAEALLSDK